MGLLMTAKSNRLPSDQPDSWSTHQLAGHQEQSAAVALRGFLTSHHNRPVRISAQGLRRVNGQVLQELIMAARRWSEQGLAFEVTDQPPVVAETLSMLGVTDDMLVGKV